jgi:hypothetical protein
MKQISYQVLKIGKIVGGYYSCGQKTNTLIIYGIGGPTVPDSGRLADSEIILKKGIDIFVPDYLGFGRSDGKFSPLNCIKTLLICYEMFKNGCEAINFYQNKKIKLKYSQIIFIGKSLGGGYVPLLPKFNPEIKNLGLFCPAIDNKSAGQFKNEESNQDFLRTIELGGYHHLYRGISLSEWKRHLENEDGLAPVDNILALKKVKLFIAHGKKDTVINFSKSVKYYQAILTTFPEKTSEVKLKLYPKGDHGQSTTKLAIKDLLNWFNL